VSKINGWPCCCFRVWLLATCITSWKMCTLWCLAGVLWRLLHSSRLMFADDNVVVAWPTKDGLGVGARFIAMDPQFQWSTDLVQLCTKFGSIKKDWRKYLGKISFIPSDCEVVQCNIRVNLYTLDQSYCA
jgi:hypothetical protein